MKSLLILLVQLVLASALTNPLPSANSSLRQDVIKCGTGQEFQWHKTEPVGNNMRITYSCGGKGNMEKDYECGAGYKASSKRDQICNPGADPNFGIFREGNDPNIMDRARIVYFCMKASINNLMPC